MPEIDYAYISENIANISRIQIRIYENKSCTGYYSATAFDPDPALPYLDRLLDAPAISRPSINITASSATSAILWSSALPASFS